MIRVIAFAVSTLFSVSAVAADAPSVHGLSAWGMFMAADWVVKLVMIGLVLASVCTWTVFIAKFCQIRFSRTRATITAELIAQASTLQATVQAMDNKHGPATVMVYAARDEFERSASVLDHAGNEGIKERLASQLSCIEAQAGRQLTAGTGILATIGSTAPFIGLFGTVWGIMNAFIGIAESKTTNLAVVAPGIAEALLATAMGLVAAIPAVIIYNLFARSITSYRQQLGDIAASIEQLVSLELDLRRVPANRQTVRAVSLAE
jgi:biopolymer transport protein ExbB